MCTVLLIISVGDTPTIPAYIVMNGGRNKTEYWCERGGTTVQIYLLNVAGEYHHTYNRALCNSYIIRYIATKSSLCDRVFNKRNTNVRFFKIQIIYM